MQKLFILLMVFTGLSACASNSEANQSQVIEKHEIVDVAIIKFKFVPQLLEIKKGQIVRWTNKEKRQYHSVWFEKQGEEESEYLFPEDIFDKKFDQPGEYEYRCGPHPEMIGTILVK